MTSAPGTLGSLKDRNRLRIVDVLRRSGTASRVELVRATGLSRTTVSKLVGELQAAGLVVEQGERSGDAGGVGRPAIALALNPRGGAVVGVDFGHDLVRVAVADLAGGVLAERRRDFDVDDDPPGAVDVAVELVRAALADADADLERTVGVGVAVSAPVVRTPEAPAGAQILPGWPELPPLDELERRLGRPVIVDNDANLGALAEVRDGAARGARNVLYVMLSGGIGAGLILDGQLVRGHRGITGELGHVVLDPHGPICRCGNRGCIETVASGPALLAAMRPLRGASFTLEDATRAAREGDEGARRLFTDAGRTVGQAVGAICNVVNPEMVVVGGDMALAGDVLVDAVRDGIGLAAIPAIRQDARVVPAQLGDRAELLGAIGLVLAETGSEALAVMTAAS
ncbi:ROK family transcriptional regulator [Patulibacter sp. SYSU D01012]|uniref:ROK family transcriptional regulator n=1 Tax=Patulibacter sp. SYSU D01012 TaxID=2817381 RepID=UPI001B310E31|nr:ROK family transcriptional regulator [Patulibacter sp. SYSU D01012]